MLFRSEVVTQPLVGRQPRQDDPLPRRHGLAAFVSFFGDPGGKAGEVAFQRVDRRPEAEALGLTAPTDTIGSTVYEVGSDDAWIPTTHDVFAAWTADRRINGSDYHGPIYNIGTSTLYTGPRSCPCSICQAGVAPHHRKD